MRGALCERRRASHQRACRAPESRENDESALTPGADDPSARLPYRCPPIGDGYDASEDGAPPDDDAAVDDEDDLVVVKHPRRVGAARVLKRLFG